VTGIHCRPHFAQSTPTKMDRSMSFNDSGHYESIFSPAYIWSNMFHREDACNSHLPFVFVARKQHFTRPICLQSFSWFSRARYSSVLINCRHLNRPAQSEQLRFFPPYPYWLAEVIVHIIVLNLFGFNVPGNYSCHELYDNLRRLLHEQN
jgi:hypothetical protein